MNVPREYQYLKEGNGKGGPREELWEGDHDLHCHPSWEGMGLVIRVFWAVRKETGCGLLGEGEGESGGVRSGCGEGMDIIRRTEVRLGLEGG